LSRNSQSVTAAIRRWRIVAATRSDLRIPESYQANVGIERQVRKSFVVEVNYTWNRNLHLWREYNINEPVLPKGFKNFTDYLASRDFANFLSKPGGVRPILNTTTPVI